MRDIKFRGKRVDNGEWVYGKYYNGPVYRVSKIEHCINYQREIEKGQKNNEYKYVIEQSIGQYTGLKDKNGVEVYEGDVVKINRFDGSFIASVVYKEYMFMYVGDTDTRGDKFAYSLSNDFDVEVIGNIHQPEYKHLRGEQNE